MGDTEVVGTRKRRRSRLVVVIVFVMLGLGVAFFATSAVLLRRASPILRARVVNTLSTRFDSRVELQELDLSGWNGLEVTGKGLKLFPRSLDRDQLSDQAVVAVGEFQFRTHWWNLLRSPMHIGEVHLSDLTIYRPSRNERAQMKQEADSKGQDARREKIEIYVEHLQIDRARLILGNDQKVGREAGRETGKPGKVPLTFNIQCVELHDIGAGQPLGFHATLVNPKPLGNIDTSGYFGPFDEHEPGSSPVRGNYTFSHADLSTIKGIGGMLSSAGRYAGKLDQIVVDGETDTPNFSLDVSGSRPVPLHTRFHAIVDGMNGNTYLQPVDAMLARSHVVATGAVTRAPGDSGHHVQLQIRIGPADIADMLRVGVKTNPPVMHGSLHMETSFDLPPGKASVAERMRLKGRFQMENVLFTNYKVQNDMNQLSLRGQGQAGQANDAAHHLIKPIPAAMQGDFTLESAGLTLTGLHCDVPGADIAVDGLYSLDGKRFAIHGKARLEAKASQMVTGWRSLLLMPVDPMLAKHGAGVEVPFEISGTEAEPKFGVDLFGRHFGNDNQKQGPKKQR
jgi:hypothetical protein